MTTPHRQQRRSLALFNVQHLPSATTMVTTTMATTTMATTHHQQRRAFALFVRLRSLSPSTKAFWDVWRVAKQRMKVDGFTVNLDKSSAYPGVFKGDAGSNKGVYEVHVSESLLERLEENGYKPVRVFVCVSCFCFVFTCVFDSLLQRLDENGHAPVRDASERVYVFVCCCFCFVF
jgi:hypothetical protein